MKSTLILLVLVAVSLEITVASKASSMLDKYIEPVLSHAYGLQKRLDMMKNYTDKLNTTSAQCQQFEITLTNATELVQNISLTAFQTELKIKRDILNVETNCSKTSSSFTDVVKCIKQNMGPIDDKIKSLLPLIKTDIENIKITAKMAEQQFKQCMKSAFHRFAEGLNDD